MKPFLEALGFDKHHRTTQATIRQSLNDRLGWVDFRLNRSPDDRKGLALLEAKPVTETGDLWLAYGKKTREYLRDYQLALGESEPVRWIVLTNFRELHILNIADREPFLKLTHDQYVDNAELIFRMLNREQLANDQITSIYHEKRRVPLGRSFLTDLKLWRLLLANGLRQAQPELTLDQAKALSQQVLNRIILIRVLETHGLQPYYSLVRQWVNWQSQVRNHDRFPFFDHELMRTFDDIETDLNTDLFKHTLMEQVSASLKSPNEERITHITVPNKYARALVDPDVYWTDQDRDIRELIGHQTGQQRYAYSTPYNYDFGTLTQDIIGQVYEQFLAHSLTFRDNYIVIRTDQKLRQQEGAYYTPMPVVRFLVEGTLGRLVRGVQDEVEQCLSEHRYNDAQIAIDTLHSLRVLDLACGSGTFLIAALETLVRTYQWWNRQVYRVWADDFGNDLNQIFASGLRLQNDPGDAALNTTIFGIDRDLQAVEMAKLNLWVLLLHTQPEDYARQAGKAPKRKLPDLSANIVTADSLYPVPDIDAMLGSEPQTRIILGNPPWGADLTQYGMHLSSTFDLAKGQFDSYALFIERATRCLRPGDLFGYVVPDSILQQPEHTRLREYILQQYHMDELVKLGEGIFEDVFRAAVAFQFTRTDSIDSAHKVRCRIVVKPERERVLTIPHGNSIQELLDKDGYAITQARFDGNKDKVFDIFASDEDMAIIDAIDRDALDWSEITTTGRGVELSKSGAIMACPHCGIWQPTSFKEKGGEYRSKICANPKCGHTIRYEECTHATIISSAPTATGTQPIIVGVGVNRYETVQVLYIDTSKAKYAPRCPNPDPDNSRKVCGHFESATYPFVAGEVRTCARCGKKYTQADVKDWVRLGINYKSPDLYTGEKLLVRKTGRGIYATIDRTGAYTNQVVFMFKLRPDRAEQHERLRLGYILGVLNSRMMLYRYYKKLGDIEWKSFPYITQKVIMGLPIRRVDFTNARQAYLHNSIADLVDDTIASRRPPDPETDAKIEQLVRQVYGVDAPVSNARIDAELTRISSYGTLLGSSIETEAEGEEEEEIDDTA